MLDNVNFGRIKAMEKGQKIEFKPCFEKANLVTQTEKGRSFDTYKCACGIECRRYGLAENLIVTKVKKGVELCEKVYEHQKPLPQIKEIEPLFVMSAITKSFGSIYYTAENELIVRVEEGDILEVIERSNGGFKVFVPFYKNGTPNDKKELLLLYPNEVITDKDNFASYR